MRIIKKIDSVILHFVSLLKWKKIVPVQTIVSNSSLLQGKVALITGGSGGLGFAIAQKFINSGCKIIIAGTNSEKLQRKAKELGIPSFLIINMTDVSSFKEAICKAERFYGHIDILVNCAGCHIERYGFNFGNVTEQEYDKIMDINLKGTYLLTQEVANNMIKNKVKGHILNISSSRSNEPSWSPYSLSKLALNGLTTGMAQVLLPYGIIVNGIAPGPSATPMQDECVSGSIYTNQTPNERYTLPEEIAEYAALLVSSLGDTIVGDTIFMSGGRGITLIK